MAETPINVAMRVPAETLEAIDARAATFGLSRTQYMLRASTGELRDPSAVDRELAKINSRLDRLERLVELGGV